MTLNTIHTSTKKFNPLNVTTLWWKLLWKLKILHTSLVLSGIVRLFFMFVFGMIFNGRICFESWSVRSKAPLKSTLFFLSVMMQKCWLLYTDYYCCAVITTRIAVLEISKKKTRAEFSLPGLHLCVITRLKGLKSVDPKRFSLPLSFL